MASFVRTTTVRNDNVRDNREHFGAVVRLVAEVLMVSLRLRSIARILLARLDQRVGAGQLAPKGLGCHPSAALPCGRPASSALRCLTPMWLGLKPWPATLPGRF